MFATDGIALPPCSARRGECRRSRKGNLCANGEEVLPVDSAEFQGKVWETAQIVQILSNRKLSRLRRCFPLLAVVECLRLQNSMNFPSWKLSMGINKSKQEFTKLKVGT